MLKVITFALFILASVVVNAETQDEIDKKCATYEKVAKMTMEYRQQDLPMSKLIKLAKDNKLMRSLAILAYKEPSWSTQDNKDKAVSQFMNKVTLKCYEVN